MTIDDIFRSYLQVFPDEHEGVSFAQSLLKDKIDVFSRSVFPGHITASAFIIVDDAMVLINHPYIKKLLQPGGHIDNQEPITDACIREALEETGYSCEIHQWHDAITLPLDIDVHEIPANPKKSEPYHWHIDFRYLVKPNLNQPVLIPELEVQEVLLKDIPQKAPYLNKVYNKIKQLKLS